MLEKIADDLWQVQHELVVPPRVHFRGRMVVARLADGRLWLWSPVPIDEALAEALAGLGEVAYVVAPNAFHHLYFGAALERYGQARGFVPPALATKRPELAHHQHLGLRVPDAWATDFDQELTGGAPKLDEVAWLHRPSKTLLVADLVFNVLEYRGWLTGLVFRMVGAHKRLAHSRVLRWMTRDREAAAASARRILAWDFERVVMAHGEIIEADAHDRLAAALGHVSGKPS